MAGKRCVQVKLNKDETMLKNYLKRKRPDEEVDMNKPRTVVLPKNKDQEQPTNEAEIKKSYTRGRPKGTTRTQPNCSNLSLQQGGTQALQNPPQKLPARGGYSLRNHPQPQRTPNATAADIHQGTCQVDRKVNAPLVLQAGPAKGICPPLQHPGQSQENINLHPPIQHPTQHQENLNIPPAIQHSAQRQENLKMPPAIQHSAQRQENLKMPPAIQHSAQRQENLKMPPPIQHSAQRQENFNMPPPSQPLAGGQGKNGSSIDVPRLFSGRRRIVNPCYLLQQLINQNHQTGGKCGTNNLMYIGEIRDGLFSTWEMKCSVCEKDFAISGEAAEEGPQGKALNVAAINAAIKADLDFSQLMALTSGLDIPFALLSDCFS